VGDGEPSRGDTLAGAVGFYQRTWQEVDAIAFTRPSPEEPCRRPDADPPPSLRWVLMHLLEETARRAGHADILRELIDGRTGR
jgi:Protein of unknown function (DUF664)